MPADQAYIYSPLATEHAEIRLLRITQDGHRKQDDRLYILMEHASLDQSLQYDALSYTWGDPTPKHTILLNGHEHRVATNLFVALRTLGVPGVITNPLWIDALCINQGDFKERGQQVALMAQLYQHAQNVRVWLGPSGPQTAAAFRVVMNPPETSDDRAQITDAELQGIDDLVGRAYWTRLWMLQEVRRGETSYAHCGDHVAPWAQLKQELVTYTFSSSIAYAVASSDHNFAQRVARLKLPSLAGNEALPAHWRYYEDVARPRSLLRILETGANFGCTDPRDHLFALLGLLPQELGIRPDYEVSTAQAFAEGTAKILQYDQNFDVLRLAGLCGDGASELPSWVANFSAGGNDDNLWRIHHWGKASMGSSFFGEYKTVGELNVRCLSVDTCEAIGRAAPPVTEQNAASWSERWPQTLRDWRALAGRHCPYNSAAEASATFWNTVFSEYIKQAIPGEQGFDEWLDQAEDNAIQPPHAIRELMQKSNVGTFFTTQNGKVGMSFRSSIEIGDTVAIFAGARLPVILRSQLADTRSRYRFVSTCTCSDYMTGEAVQGPALALSTPDQVPGQGEPITSNKIAAAKPHHSSTRSAAELETYDRVSDPARFDLSQWPKPIFLKFFQEAYRDNEQPIAEKWPELPGRMRLLDPSAVRTHFIDLYETMALPDSKTCSAIVAAFIGSESASLISAILTNATRGLLCSSLTQAMKEAFEDDGVPTTDSASVLTSLNFESTAASWMLQAIDAPARTHEARKMAELLFEEITLV